MRPLAAILIIFGLLLFLSSLSDGEPERVAGIIMMILGFIILIHFRKKKDGDKPYRSYPTWKNGNHDVR